MKKILYCFALLAMVVVPLQEAYASVPEQALFVEYVASGQATTFAYPFKALSESDIVVTVDGVLKTLTTYYTLTGIGETGGGSVIFLSAPVANSKVNISRLIDINRVTNYTKNGDLRAAVLNNDFDRAVMLIQQLSEILGRVPRVSRASGLQGLDLPVEGGKAIGWNEDGTALIGITAVADAVEGPASSTDGALMCFDGITGKLTKECGSIYYASSNLNTLVATIGSTPATLVVTDTETLTGNLSVPSTLKLIVEKGGLIDCSTFTLAINGSFSAGRHSAFKNCGTDVSGLKGTLFPEWFEAVGDDSTDDGAALQTCITEAVAVGGICSIGTKTYKSTTALTVPAPGNITIEGEGGISGYQWAYPGPTIHFVGSKGISMNTSSASVGNVTIKNLKLMGDNDGTMGAADSNHGISQTSTSNDFFASKLENLYIEGFSGNGIKLDKEFNNAFIGIELNKNNGHGAEISGSNSTHIKGGYIHTINAGYTGWWIYSTANIEGATCCDDVETAYMFGKYVGLGDSETVGPIVTMRQVNIEDFKNRALYFRYPGPMILEGVRFIAKANNEFDWYIESYLPSWYLSTIEGSSIYGKSGASQPVTNLGDFKNIFPVVKQWSYFDTIKTSQEGDSEINLGYESLSTGGTTRYRLLLNTKLKGGYLTSPSDTHRIDITDTGVVRFDNNTMFTTTNSYGSDLTGGMSESWSAYPSDTSCWSVSGTTATCDATKTTPASNLLKTSGIVVGNTYKVTYTVSNMTQGAVHIKPGGYDVMSPALANGTYTGNITVNNPSADGNVYFIALEDENGDTFDGDITDVSVQLLNAVSVGITDGSTGVTQSQADNSTKLATTAYVDTGLGGKASVSTPVPATTCTNQYISAIATSGAGTCNVWPTFNQNTSGTAAGLSGTPALPDGTTATTQAAGSNDTKISTNAYVDTKGIVTGTSSTNFTVSAAQKYGSYLYLTNAITATLPTVAGRESVCAYSTDANVKLIIPTADRIRLAGTALTTGVGIYNSGTSGDSICLNYDGTGWSTWFANGTWANLSTTNLVAKWKLADTTYTDTSGNSNDLTGYNSPTATTGHDSGSNLATQFTAASSMYLERNSTASLTIIGSITMAAWVKLDSLGNYRIILSKNKSDNAEKQYRMYVGDDNKVTCQLSNSGSLWDASAVGATALNTSYHHVACVYNGTDIRIYIDSVLDSNGANNPKTYSSGIYNGGTGTIRIADDPGQHLYWNGAIDDVKIYSRALSATEVKVLHLGKDDFGGL